VRLCYLALASGLLLLSIPAHAADAREVLVAPRQRIQTADLQANGHLVRVDADGTRISTGVSIKAHWFPGVLRILVELGQPQQAHRDMREHILLEMHENGQNTIRVAVPGDTAPTLVPFEKWDDSPIGPGFNFEDFWEPQYFWPGQIAADEAKFGAHDCDVLKSTPGTADRTHYAEIKTWLDHSIGFPVYVEKTLKGTGTVKEFTYYGLRHEGGVWSAHQVEAKTRGQSGSTLLIIDRGSVKAHLALKDFSPEQLIRF
jgi:hypothetical protein